MSIWLSMQFQAGHNCYSWLTWLQDPDPQEMLAFEYSHPCEPYVIALSDALPRYDERFRGRNQNKIEQLAHMAAWGFEWHLLPSHFVLHMPHMHRGQDLSWDGYSTPYALSVIMQQEVEQEPEFRRHVIISVPLPLHKNEYRPLEDKPRKRKHPQRTHRARS